MARAAIILLIGTWFGRRNRIISDNNPTGAIKKMVLHVPDPLMATRWPQSRDHGALGQ